MTDKRSEPICLNFHRLKYTLVNWNEWILLKIVCHYSNVPMNSVHVDKFIANIGENANVRCVTFTNDVRNNTNTVVFEKWDLIPSQNR